MTEGAVTVIAGNGASLAEIPPGRILATDRIWRTNNFFFEPHYYLGRRVDMAMIGGDPRLAPFVLQTLAKAAKSYELVGWTSDDTRVARARRRLPVLNWVPPAPLYPKVQAKLDQLQSRYQCYATTGSRALARAYSGGARHFILAGIDLYAGPRRYVYKPGRHQRDLLGADLQTRGFDRQLHNPELDRALIGWIAEQAGVSVWRASDGTALDDMLDLADLRDGPLPAKGTKPPLDDWETWAGVYPIALLKGVRRARRLQLRLIRSERGRSGLQSR